MDRDQDLPLAVSEDEWQSVVASTAFVFIDGPSSSGKSSIKNSLIAEPALQFAFAPRYTTRDRRPDDAASGDYYFVAAEAFARLIAQGDMLEYRHFLFGMSYGVGRSSLARAARHSRRVLSLMNIGSAQTLKRMLPDAVCAFIDVPIDMIERRMRSRGLNSDEQIRERLGNAIEARKHIDEYDIVIRNLDGGFEYALTQLVDGLRARGVVSR